MNGIAIMVAYNNADKLRLVIYAPVNFVSSSADMELPLTVLGHKQRIMYNWIGSFLSFCGCKWFRIKNYDHYPILLTWITFNSDMDK